MWSDKETAEDLLGYTVHASLLKNVVTEEKNLPITIGLYGDWGSGKSSILKILESQLKQDDDTVVVYFDGWSFESFDDAKMALIQGIIDALEQDKKFFAKLGDKTADLKAAFVKLRKSISWMRLMKISLKTLIPIATAASTGGLSLIIPMLLEAFKEHKGDLGELLTSDKAENFLNDVLKGNDEEKKYEAVREFRKDFEDLINKSNQGKIVVLIDDLDRCLPRHIIENLEAIKLFLNVPKTAFIIAADSYIVANAIKSEYQEIIAASASDRPNLGDSYMEKFIQLPYRIPALSPKEVETYVTLLFCESFLEKKAFGKIRDDFGKFIQENKFDRYGWGNIKNVLQADTPEGLGETIGFVSHFSTIIGNSLKWNPRLIKRFLNAYEIRANLLQQAGLSDNKSKFALLKLMLIEQKHVEQFKQLNTWVMNSLGVPPELIKLEGIANGSVKDSGEHKDWNTPELLKLVSTEPLFSNVDMKELFWVSRDNIVDQMNGLSLVSTRVRSVFTKAYNASTDPIRENVCQKEIALLSSSDIEDLFDLVDSKILTNPDEKDGYGIYYFCDKHHVERAYMRLIGILSRIDTKKIPYSVGNKFKEILEKYNNDKKFMALIQPNGKLMRSINGEKK